MLNAALQGFALAVLAIAGPDGSASEGTAKRFDLIGLQVCIGDPGDGQPCHVKVYPPPRAEDDADDTSEQVAPIEVSVFGKSLCIGDVPEPTACDVRLGAPDGLEA